LTSPAESANVGDVDRALTSGAQIIADLFGAPATRPMGRQRDRAITDDRVDI
jgi:hypothetical protein